MGTASHGHPSTAWAGGLGPGLLLSCPPYPPPLPGVGVGWQGMRVPSWRGSWGLQGCGCLRPSGSASSTGAAPTARQPSAWGPPPVEPPHYNTNSLLCLRQKSPVGRHRAPPVRDTGAVGGQAWPVPWGHTRACAWAGVYSRLRPTAGTHGPRPPLHQASGEQPLRRWRSGHGWTALPDSIRQKEQI